MQEMINRAKELLSDGTVNRVLGWRRGDMSYNPEPSYFETAEDLDANFVYNGFCGANLSKYMIEGSKLEGKTLVFLKPCDSYSFNQLIAEHRVDRDKAYIIGVGCMGKLSFEKIKEQGVKGITNITIDDANENITVETLYGEKTLAYKDCMLVLLALADRAQIFRHIRFNILAGIIGIGFPITAGQIWNYPFIEGRVRLFLIKQIDVFEADALLAAAV